ncbi:hypothetical protein ASG35_13250 [Burkholderia sp. Leaf177]|nr:DDE-type integrase/transposase/recombinase [Burkholderia sp. Leaf177]KQR77209.1 hypothetical protein ASG35_13250 [Burkholderia sp. Leaf177]
MTCCPEEATLRCSTYLDNLIKQAQRRIRFRADVMLGFKRFRSAAITIEGIESMHCIRKGQSALALEGTAVLSILCVALFNR